jgi:hypothetical protein
MFLAALVSSRVRGAARTGARTVLDDWTLRSWVRIPLEASMYVCIISVFVLFRHKRHEWRILHPRCPTKCLQTRFRNLYKRFWEEIITYFPRYDTNRIENDPSNNSCIVSCVFVTAVTFLPSRCLAMISGILPSRCLATIGGYTHRRTDWWEGFMKYAVQMASGDKIHIPSFIKNGSGI